MGTVSPTNITDGTVADAADVNSNINLIADEFNGNIENANIASAAAIDGSKLADDSIGGGKLDYASTGSGGIWWEELGRDTLAVAGDTIDVSSIPDRKYLKFLIYLLPSGAINSEVTFNADTGANYAYRRVTNGVDGGSTTGDNGLNLQSSAVTSTFQAEINVTNLAGAVKPLENRLLIVIDAATTPTQRNQSGIWENSSDPVDQITVTNTGGGSYAIGSEVVVLGHN